MMDVIVMALVCKNNSGEQARISKRMFISAGLLKPAKQSIKVSVLDFAEECDQGTYELEGEVAPGEVRNFTEQYLGLVNTHSECLSIKILSVDEGS
jgi:hypothetical protein